MYRSVELLHAASHAWTANEMYAYAVYDRQHSMLNPQHNISSRGINYTGYTSLFFHREKFHQLTYLRDHNSEKW